MNYKFVILFILLSISSSSAQRLTAKAELETKAGKETITYLSSSFNMSYTWFMEMKNGKTSKIYARDIISITLTNNEKYAAFEVDVVEGGVEKKLLKKNVFLKVLEEGDVNLYTYKNDFIYISANGEDPELLSISRKRFVNNEIGERILVNTDKVYDMKKEVGFFELKKDYFHQVKKRIRKEIPIKSSVRLEGKSIRKVVAEHNKLENNTKSYFTDAFSMRIGLGVKNYIINAIPEDEGVFRLNTTIEVFNPSLSKAASIVFSYANKLTEPDDGVGMLGARRYFNQNNRFQPHVTLGFNTLGKEFFLPYLETGVHYKLSKLSLFASFSLIDQLNPYGFELGTSYQLD